MIDFSIKDGYFWIGRILLTWWREEISIGWYDSEHEHLIVEHTWKIA